MSVIDIDMRQVGRMNGFHAGHKFFPLLFEISIKCYIWQVNPDMIIKLENAGLSFVGKDETRQRMEVDASYLCVFYELCILLTTIFLTFTFPDC